MLVRRLTPTDATVYQALRLAGLAEAPSAFSSSYEEEREFPLTRFEQWLAVKPDRGSFGAFEGSELVGVVTLGREDKRKAVHKAHIWGMYVTPPGRRKGVARKLLVEALSLARSVPEIRQINVGVNAENTSAVRLYESVGFETYGRERGALLVDGKLHDELHMALRLGVEGRR